MEKIKDFLRSLFTPEGVKRYRYMSTVVTLLIFMIEVYILFVPINTYYNMQIVDYTNENEFSTIFYNIEDSYDEGIEGIKNSGYHFDDNGSNYTLVSDDEAEGIMKYCYRYYTNNVTYYVYYVFDVNGTVDAKIKEIYDRYEELFPDESAEKLSYASMVVYYDSLSGKDIDTQINYYHGEDVSVATDILSELSYKDLYQVEASDTTYFMLFLSKYLWVEIPTTVTSSDDRMQTTYDFAVEAINDEDKDYSISAISSINDFSKVFAITIASSFIGRSVILYLGNCLIYALLFPIILAFIMWMFLRRKGCLRTFKEYYNTISIVSIIPALVGFILGWFVGTIAGMVYLGMMSLISIIMIYRVIAIPDVVDNY